MPLTEIQSQHGHTERRLRVWLPAVRTGSGAPFVQARTGDEEGFCPLTVETIGCGCPALVSDVPATRALDVLRVAPGDSAALAARTSECLALPAPERAALADAQWRSVGGFSWANVESGYANALRVLAAAHRSAR